LALTSHEVANRVWDIEDVIPGMVSGCGVVGFEATADLERYLLHLGQGEFAKGIPSLVVVPSDVCRMLHMDFGECTFHALG